MHLQLLHVCHTFSVANLTPSTRTTTCLPHVAPDPSPSTCISWVACIPPLFDLDDPLVTFACISPLDDLERVSVLVGPFYVQSPFYMEPFYVQLH